MIDRLSKTFSLGESELSYSFTLEIYTSVQQQTK